MLDNALPMLEATEPAADAIDGAAEAAFFPTAEPTATAAPTGDATDATAAAPFTAEATVEDVPPLEDEPPLDGAE